MTTMTTEALAQLFDQLDADPGARDRVDEALRAIDDASVIVEALVKFPTELTVANAAAARLREIAPHDSVGWAHIARVREQYARTPEDRREVAEILEGVISRDPDNRIALDTLILHYGFDESAPVERLLEWSERYAELEPPAGRAICLRAKVLLKWVSRDKALSYLRSKSALSSRLTDESLHAARTLLHHIERGDDVLSQWP